MKRALAWTMALALFMPQFSTAEGQNMTQESKEVLASVHAMTSSFQSGDIPGVMATYEPGATVVFEPGAPVSDANLLQQMFEGMAQVNPVFEYNFGHEVVVSGDLAMHIAPWSMTGMAPDGQRISQSGLSVSVLRRQTDGSWKLVIDNPHGGRLLPANN